MTYRLVERITDSGPVWIFDMDSLFDADRHSACPSKAQKLEMVGTYCQRAFFLIEPEP